MSAFVEDRYGHTEYDPEGERPPFSPPVLQPCGVCWDYDECFHPSGDDPEPVWVPERRVGGRVVERKP